MEEITAYLSIVKHWSDRALLMKLGDASGTEFKR